ncbi:hypothetical protein psyc5s11_29060 [Clostridium gelidum]|uniref:Uncharacterized protein n=1 Tax=Clostridium gelidum TaxID=704125 RepID=A0ABM7T4F3_9CLOT|nr:hypothetical protein [Clostridium gelidum]BCZ46839.1 hypothetical protein psyc5s11_29060 [Clostridium gelidum]
MEKYSECQFCKSAWENGYSNGKRLYYCTYSTGGKLIMKFGSDFIGEGETSSNNELNVKTSPFWCPIRKKNLKQGISF